MANWYKININPKMPESSRYWSVELYQNLVEHFMQSWECPLVEKIYNKDELRTDIIIDDDTIISYRYTYAGASLYINDDLIGTALYYGNPVTIWVVCADEFFYFAHKINNTRLITYLYEMIDDEIYEGWGESVTFQSLLVKKKDPEIESTIEYKHHKVLDYIAKFGAIDFTNSRFFTEEHIDDSTINIITSIIDENFLSCSNVIPDTIFSFDETRFYSLDTNTLVALEPVEPYEETSDNEEDG